MRLRVIIALFLFISCLLWADYQMPSKGSVTVSALNVRTGPGTNYPVLTVISEGTSVAITGVSGNWYQVNFEQHTGVFVYASYIQVTQTITITDEELENQGNKNFMKSLTFFDPTTQLPADL